MRAQDRYADMLHLPCPGPRTRPRMPRGDRAAQFAPFAALVGYDAVISETGRLTEAKRLLSEDALALLDRKQQFLATCLDQRPQVTVTSVSYTHLDVYKRQTSGWPKLLPRKSGKTTFATR